ncbi:hypothetical protein F5Y15DRAFT_375998 [Xylariaceae sp. FL0016]|nr:hypothetical protein F5Y15DRAFT_375998 [Xylariaceae sp. FL0016]
MGDPLTIIGSIAAISQIACGLAKLTRDLRLHAKTMQSAPEEINFFILETTNFTNTINLFHDTIRDAAEHIDDSRKEQWRRSMYGIRRQCKFVNSGMIEVVRRFKDVSRRNSGSLQTFWARIAWLLKKPDVTGLRLTIATALQSLNLLGCILSLEKLRCSNDNLERLEMLQIQAQNTVPTLKRASEALEKHHERHGQATEMVPGSPYDEITEDTWEVEKLVISALHSYRDQVQARQSSARERTPDASRLVPNLAPPRKLESPPTSPAATAMNPESQREDSTAILGSPVDEREDPWNEAKSQIIEEAPKGDGSRPKQYLPYKGQILYREKPDRRCETEQERIDRLVKFGDAVLVEVGRDGGPTDAEERHRGPEEREEKQSHGVPKVNECGHNHDPRGSDLSARGDRRRPRRPRDEGV